MAKITDYASAVRRHLWNAEQSNAYGLAPAERRRQVYYAGWSADAEELSNGYVGATEQCLNRRRDKHRSEAKRGNPTPFYEKWRERGEPEVWIVLSVDGVWTPEGEAAALGAPAVFLSAGDPRSPVEEMPQVGSEGWFIMRLNTQAAPPDEPDPPTTGWMRPTPYGNGGNVRRGRSS